jgi:hypothetical protein
VNCGGFLDGRAMLDYVRDAIHGGSPDLVNDLMFELKKLNNGEFLRYDASVALMEVSPNVIIQV